MKKIIFLLNALTIVVLFTALSCRKGKEPAGSPPTVNSAPDVNAGPDISLQIPLTYTILSGSAYDANSNIKEYKWRKIAGPESYFIESSYNLSPKLFWLEEGGYEFELSATDRDGLTDKDTVKVGVHSTLRKYVVSNLIRNAAGFSIAQIPDEVRNNLKWVFGKSAGRCEQADAGPLPNIDYNFGGYYYMLLTSSQISVFGGYTGNVDLIIYY